MTGREGVDGGYGENEAESVFAVEVEAEEAFLADESEGFVEGECGLVVVFGLEHDLQPVRGCNDENKMRCLLLGRRPVSSDR